MGKYRIFLKSLIRTLTVLFIYFHVNTVEAAVPGDSIIISGINIDGNKVTKSEIIYRELTFKKGDKIAFSHLYSVLDSSTQNLMNTFLFNFVSSTADFNEDSTHVIILINVSERWYLWPEPVFNLVDINLNQWWREKDFSKTTYGLILTKKNFRGKNETVSVGVQQGFSERYSLTYRIPYINRRLKDGISIGASYLQSKQVLFSAPQSIPLYYKSPDYLRRDLNLSLLYSYRRGFYHTTGLYTSYRKTEVRDSVFVLNRDYFITGKNTQRYTTVGIWFVDDHRDFHAYPLRGYFYSIDLAKQGFGFLDDDTDQISVVTILKGYKYLGMKFFVAASARARFTNRSKQSFFNQVSIGSGSTGLQGYDNYLILGQNTYLFKSALKYNLLAERIIYLNFVPLDKFNRVPLAMYINLFSDAGYVENKHFTTSGDLTNQLLYGFGAGIDFVTYYNLILRVEYSFNKFGENGLYIHFSSPI